ncbi:efflux RND transporter permease subunit [Halobacillus karajensis]|uniref:Toluene efflux pump membrane transporter TtgB n=1 Tax=Halobacillus karajensis TaxID=195088 RepID=A0A024P1I7_9BACI|nr:efflux RND transporter permease subunit [Halobacillus karajensis]CDQ19538.1 Toluene efflux pump membrane transporter TtgB [Halobacillus karajensis]CDQ22000.1 Toluene efflux pump membrane transporter TtgB [Halobacillus karajensis]CDQ27841.1 Toluene efflux pump membrane transporter TtgB [Halobacillus karajensis]
MRTILNFRKIVWVFIGLLIFTGILTYLQLPKRDIPEINVNVASISTVYPGATPQEVERTIITPMEEELLKTDGIEKITSASATGFGTVTVTLEERKSEKTKAQIQQKVSEVSRLFPEEVKNPDIHTDMTSSAVASYHITSDNREDLYQLRDQLNHWEKVLTDLPGVDSLLIKGLPEQRISIRLDQPQLNNYHLSPFSIINTLRDEITPSPIGTEKKEGTLRQLIFNKYSDIEDMENLVIGETSNGERLSLKDIGSTQVVNQNADDLIYYKGQPALSVTVLAKEGVNIRPLQDQLSDHINRLEKDLPAAITVDRFYTQSTVIDEVFTNLIISFGVSFIAVIFIMFLGLPLSSAVLVALSIPISIIIGLIPLPYVGVDLNQISMMGMIIAIGILVDDAIVVNDHIQRRFQLGDGPFEGTIKGVREVWKSIITSTLMIIFSFLPLSFLSGSNGDFIRALPTVLILTLIASTIIALLFIPTVQYTRKKRQSKESPIKSGLFGKGFDRLENVYADRLLPFTTRKPLFTALAGILTCTLLALLITRIPFEFFSAADRPEVTISIENPQGTAIQDTEKKLKDIAEYLEKNDKTITETAIYAGAGIPNLFNSGLERSGENTGQVVIRVDRDQTSAEEFIKKWKKPLRNKFPESDIFLETIVSGPPPSPPVEIQVQGSDLDILVSEAENARDLISHLNSTEMATINAKKQPFTEYSPERNILDENNITIEQVTSQLQLANTGVPLGTFDNGINRIPMEVLVDDGLDEGIALDQLTIISQNSRETEGPPNILSMDEMITTTPAERIGVIPHLNGKRTITVEGYPAEGMEQTFSTQSAEVIKKIKDQLPKGYSLVESGESDAQSDFFVEITKLFVIVLFLIYLTIAIHFNSLLMPLLITFTVFLAVTGAIVGLFISGQPLSFLAVLGIVSLSGIVVRNSVILIEFIENNHKFYRDRVEAVVEAGRARIRPIILTSLTSIAALTPIIFTDDVLFKPLAISIISGLLFSTVLTLLLVPSFYLIISKKKEPKEY